MKLDFDSLDIEALALALAPKVAQALHPQLAASSRRMEQDQILTIAELSGYLKLSVDCIYKLVSSGKIPSFKAGKYLRFRKSAIHAWIERNSRKTLDDPYNIIQKVASGQPH